MTTSIAARAGVHLAPTSTVFDFGASAARLTCRAAFAVVILASSCAAPRAPTEVVGVTTVTRAATTIRTTPLSSWVDGASRRAIMDFVNQVADETSRARVPVQDRIAVFDDNGTLWPEKPLPAAAFATSRLKMAQSSETAKHRNEQFPISNTKEDAEKLLSMTMGQALSVLAQTHAGMTDEAAESAARGFLLNARHPTFNQPYVALTYTPMRELLAYLRDHGFTIYLSSDSDEDFTRAYAPESYQIPRERIIGSSFDKNVAHEKGRLVVKLESELASFNDGDEKVVNITRRIGRRPLLAVGNVGTGGDVPMLEYVQGNNVPSLGIVIRHDDATRELAYDESDGATLEAARERGFVVVSMKNDWTRVFDAPPTTTPAR